ncbi:hypothetical protein GGS21DRAFT_509457 [Xylaria nigripes]|nr:hypothetical protein GGS21DRAFT_509457 [Xylaria nigripes]
MRQRSKFMIVLSLQHHLIVSHPVCCLYAYEAAQMVEMTLQLALYTYLPKNQAKSTLTQARPWMNIFLCINMTMHMPKQSLSRLLQHHMLSKPSTYFDERGSCTTGNKSF